MFDGGAAPVHDKVRGQMFQVYCATKRPGFADAKAQELLEEGRRYFRSSGLQHQQIVEAQSGCRVFPWVGDKTMNTLDLLLGISQIEVTNEGVSLNVRCSEAELRHAARELIRAGLPAPKALAGRVPHRLVGKYDAFLSEELLNENYASAQLDVDAAQAVLRQWANGSSHDRSAT